MPDIQRVQIRRISGAAFAIEFIILYSGVKQQAMNKANQLNKYLPNLFEFGVIVIAGIGMYALISSGYLNIFAIKVIILLLSFIKTGWFIYESSKQILAITRQNLPYHRFLLMLGINMIQIILSFAVDYFLLHLADAGSFNGIIESNRIAYQFFDFFYYSCLNFSFFGFGDITPNHISAKIITLTEVLLAFASVIFVLSDFVTLKDSLGKNDKNT